MIAKELLSPIKPDYVPHDVQTVEAETHIFDLIHILLESKSGYLKVVDNDEVLGLIDYNSMLLGISRLLNRKDDSSTIILECAYQDYSASSIAHAVEDADAHLVDLLTRPITSGKLEVTLRVALSDPTSAVKSLERYGYTVKHSYGREDFQQILVASERLLALQSILNV